EFKLPHKMETQFLSVTWVIKCREHIICRFLIAFKRPCVSLARFRPFPKCLKNRQLADIFRVSRALTASVRQAIETATPQLPI
ncbi:hypothetical protein, partial [Brucella suis]|uniref:hypothetical protein n=1 Tax=Brucella suis TaxID=29461 RepID=UPI001AEBECE2